MLAAEEELIYPSTVVLKKGLCWVATVDTALLHYYFGNCEAEKRHERYQYPCCTATKIDADAMRGMIVVVVASIIVVPADIR